MKTSETGSCGVFKGNAFRSCQQGDWFQYDLALSENVPLSKTDSVSIILRLSLTDRGRKGGVYVNGALAKAFVVPAQVKGATKDRFFEMPVTVSAADFYNKKSVPIRFVPVNGSPFPRLYNIRFIKKE